VLLLLLLLLLPLLRRPDCCRIAVSLFRIALKKSFFQGADSQK
jgi:hypothetical protein